MRSVFYCGALLLEAPLRQGDLVHSQQAVLDQFEQMLARDHISDLSRAETHSWGFVLRLRVSPPFLAWWNSQCVINHLWLSSLETDPYGTRILLSHAFVDPAPNNPFHRPINSPFGACAAICNWRDTEKAAAHLRRECIGPALLTAYGSDLCAIVSTQITKDLALPEGSFNSTALPHYCRTEWGTLIRIDPANLNRALEYFTVTQPLDCSIPTVEKIGGLLTAIYALGPAELRIALAPEHKQDPALDHVALWLRSLTRHAGKRLTSA